MSIALIGLTLLLVLFFLYAHVSTHVEKYANSGNIVSRVIILVIGLAMGAGGAFLFLRSVAEPSWALGVGFLLGPLLAVGACFYLVVALFFPLQQVRDLVRYSFRHKLTDNI